MELFEEFLAKIEDEQQQIRTRKVLSWVSDQYPQLVPRIAWNQPMFTDHGTFIIGFSVAKHHLAITPEKAGIDQLVLEIEKSGYSYTSMIVRFPWNKPINYDLLMKMIEFNLDDKKECVTFWRK